MPAQQISDIEPPISWALVGIVIMATWVILFNHFAMDVEWFYTLVAVLLTYFMVVSPVFSLYFRFSCVPLRPLHDAECLPITILPDLLIQRARSGSSCVLGGLVRFLHE